MAAPFISFGMIVKNEIRCIERCLKSLEGLRQALPCQVVIADTGSTDGTREIAQQYADVFFDFEWINDFAAARNAVIEHCTGEWFIPLDADEWLSEDYEELVQFCHSPQAKRYQTVGLRLRNHHTSEENGMYTEFTPQRFFRMSLEPYYVGAIHETVRFKKSPKGIPRNIILQKVFLHHDGYMPEVKESKKKNERNLSLLLPILEEHPRDLRTLTQCIEATDDVILKEEFIQKGVQLIRNKEGEKPPYIPTTLRHGLSFYVALKKIDRLQEIWELAQSVCPDSVYIKLDGAAAMIVGYYSNEDFQNTVKIGRKWLVDRAEFDQDPHNTLDLEYGPLIFPSSKIPDLQMMVFCSACKIEDWELAEDLLYQIQIHKMPASRVGAFMESLLQSAQHFNDPQKAIKWVMVDQEPLFQQDKPTEMTAKQYQIILLGKIEIYFRTEQPLKAVIAQFDTDLGRSAKALLQESDEAMLSCISEINDWGNVLPLLLETMLEKCLPFPERFYDLTEEAMSSIAAGLTNLQGMFKKFMNYRMTLPPKTLEEKVWYSNVAACILAAGHWSDPSDGVYLCKQMAYWQEEILERLYRPEMLDPKYLHLLPTRHRFGWYLSKAVTAMQTGDSVKFVKALREGLETAPGYKKLVQMLLDQQITEPQADDIVTPELEDLAKKVRVFLSQYSIDSPTVRQLLQRPEYQKLLPLLGSEYVNLYGNLS